MRRVVLVRFKSQKSDSIINKYASSSFFITECTNNAIATISNLQIIQPTVSGKTVKIVAISLKMNVREQCTSERHGTKVTSHFEPLHQYIRTNMVLKQKKKRQRGQVVMLNMVYA